MIRISSGKEIWQHHIKIPLNDEAGNCIGVVGLSEDITERENSENELRESEAKFRNLVEGSLQGIAVHDEEDWQIHKCRQ